MHLFRNILRMRTRIGVNRAQLNFFEIAGGRGAMAESERSTEPCRAVHQLVARVATSLPLTRVASVEDVLGHLETTDENFHK